jgi:hypothetical protein
MESPSPSVGLTRNVKRETRNDFTASFRPRFPPPGSQGRPSSAMAAASSFAAGFSYWLRVLNHYRHVVVGWSLPFGSRSCCFPRPVLSRHWNYQGQPKLPVSRWLSEEVRSAPPIGLGHSPPLRPPHYPRWPGCCLQEYSVLRNCSCPRSFALHCPRQTEPAPPSPATRQSKSQR